MDIYLAYRLKKGVGGWDTLNDLKVKGRMQVEQAIHELYLSWEDNPEMQAKILIELELGFDTEHVAETGFDRLLSSNYLQREYAKAMVKQTRFFDLSVYIEVRKMANRYYLVPVCGGLLSKTLDFMENDRRLEQYGYWEGDHAKPEDVSTQAWAGRKKVWAKLLDKKNGYYANVHNYLIVDICSMHTFDVIDPLMVGQPITEEV